MKNVTLLIFLFVGSLTFAQKMGNLKVEYNFLAINEGYDHDTKMELYVDGNLVMTSTVKKESNGNNFSYKLTRGKHIIKLVNYTFYDGNFEVRSIANNYSTEGTIEREVQIKKKNTIKVTFDLNQPDPIVTIK